MNETAKIRPPRRRTRISRLANFIWPAMGLKRYAVYLSHRIGRMPGTAHAVAAGLASGAAMSMTPFIGFHFLLAGLLAWALRGNLLASAIGTAIGNPWTFPLIWIWSYRLGCWIMGRSPTEDPMQQRSMVEALQSPLEALTPLLLPMMVGSLPAVIVVWFGIYWPVRGAIGKYRQKRTERRQRKAMAFLTRMKEARQKRSDENAT